MDIGPFFKKERRVKLQIHYQEPYCSKQAEAQNTIASPSSMATELVIAACDVTDTSRGFDDQVSELIADARMSPERLRALDQALSAVERTLDAVWPGSKAVVFGSVSCGLAFETSDLDISVTLPPDIEQSPARTEYETLVRAKMALESAPHLYRDVRIITVTRVPIITLYFVPTSVHCDLVLQKNIGATSGQLVRFLLHSDKRAIKLAAVLKQWGRVNGVTDSSRLSNYPLTLMLIFYLQQQNVLPSVEELQRNIEPVIVTGFDYSNIAFERRKLPTTNNCSLYALLGGFFEYYEVFEFAKYVICPYLGSPVERVMFGSVASVPDVFCVYKASVSGDAVKPLPVSSPLCVQDPLIHSNSCATSVDDATLSCFKDAVRVAARLYRRRRRDDFLTAIMTVL